MPPVVSHADLHALPEADLKRAHRTQIARVFEAQQQGVSWQGNAPVRYTEVDAITFVRADGSARVPVAAGRAAMLGGAGALVAVVGAMVSGAVGTTLLVLGALCLAGCVYFLQLVPKEKVALAEGATRLGLYLLDDALIAIGDPEKVIHRPELCDTRVIPKGAIISIDVAPQRDGAGTRYAVVMTVRKTTGEIVEHSLDDYATPVQSNPLAGLMRVWLSGSPDAP